MSPGELGQFTNRSSDSGRSGFFLKAVLNEIEKGQYKHNKQYANSGMKNMYLDWWTDEFKGNVATENSGKSDFNFRWVSDVR